MKLPLKLEVTDWPTALLFWQVLDADGERVCAKVLVEKANEQAEQIEKYAAVDMDSSPVYVAALVKKVNEQAKQIEELESSVAYMRNDIDLC